MKIIFMFTLLSLIGSSNAKIVDVSTYGIVPGKDVTQEVNDLVDSLKDERNVTLLFPKGQYDFYPENAIEAYRRVANHDNGLKKMAFPLFGQHNLTVDGNGSLFMFHGRIVPFTLEEVEKVTLKNFSIDFARPFHAELTIVEHNKKGGGVVVETDVSQYPYTIRNGMAYFDRFGLEDSLAGFNIVFDPETEAPISETWRYNLKNGTVRVEPVGEGRFRIVEGFDTLPPIGSVLVVYGANPTSRLVHAIQVCNSKDVRIENVTVMAAGGMGLIVERTENVTLDGMKLTSNAARLVATRADATHFIGCKGTIRVENCTFEHMLDDGLNVHGAYVPVVRRVDEKTFLCEISHPQQWGLTFAEAGDRIAILSRETILPFFETEVASIKKLNERRFLLTVENLPPEMPEAPLSIENLSWNPDLIMTDNIVRKNRARSVLVTTKGKVLIEDNYFSSQMHGILIEGDNNYWYESGAVQDVLIRNNTFDNVGFGTRNGYPLVTSPLFTSTQGFGETQYHRNVRFESNKIRSFNGNFVLARSVEGLTVSGNTIEFSSEHPKSDSLVSLLLEYCREVKIQGNQALGFDRPLEIVTTENSEAIEVRGNGGMQRNTESDS